MAKNEEDLVDCCLVLIVCTGAILVTLIAACFIIGKGVAKWVLRAIGREK